MPTGHKLWTPPPTGQTTDIATEYKPSPEMLLKMAIDEIRVLRAFHEKHPGTVHTGVCLSDGIGGHCGSDSCACSKKTNRNKAAGLL